MRDGLHIPVAPLAGVGALTGLTRLVAAGNYTLTELPPELGTLTLLEHLDASCNMLWALPDALCGLTRLRCLDVSSNSLQSLPQGISALGALTRLDAGNNSRLSLPDSLGRCSALRELELSWTWSDMGPLWAGASGLTALRMLRVTGNGVAELPDGAGNFPALECVCSPSVSLSLSAVLVTRQLCSASHQWPGSQLAGLPCPLCTHHTPRCVMMSPPVPSAALFLSAPSLHMPTAFLTPWQAPEPGHEQPGSTARVPVPSELPHLPGCGGQPAAGSTCWTVPAARACSTWAAQQLLDRAAG